MFVVRTAGQVLDAGAMESIKYALQVLHANSIIVLGHQNCGAVKAVYDAVTTSNYSTCLSYPFLCQYIRPSITPAGIIASTENNIINTVNIIRNTFKLAPSVVKGAYYDMETGKVSLIYPFGTLFSKSVPHNVFSLRRKNITGPDGKVKYFRPRGCRKFHKR